jgi:Restriction endonuclease
LCIYLILIIIIHRLKQGGGDGGIDIFAFHDNNIFAIQCKNHEKPPGVPVAREFESVMSRTTKDAVGILVIPVNGPLYDYGTPIKNWIKTSPNKIILTNEENICKDIRSFKKPQTPEKVKIIHKKNGNLILHLRIIIFLLIIIIIIILLK